MADIQWIKITTNIFDNEKITLIEEMPESDSIIVIWFKLLALAGKKNDAGLIYITRDLPYDIDKLARVFRREKKIVEMAIDTFVTFGMIYIENDVIAISNWEKHQNVDGLEKIREQNRARQIKHREKQKMLSSNVTVTSGHAIEKRREEKKRKEKNYSEEFGQLWKINPNKTDKELAWTNYQKVVKEVDHELLLKRWTIYIKSCDKKGTELQYITRLHNWLDPKKKKYMDDVENIIDMDEVRDRYYLLSGKVMPEHYEPTAEYRSRSEEYDRIGHRDYSRKYKIHEYVKGGIGWQKDKAEGIV